MRFAVARVLTSITLGASFAVYGPGLLDIDPKWGVAGITIAAGLAGWLEFSLLRHALRKRIGPVDLPGRTRAVLWAAAAHYL